MKLPLPPWLKVSTGFSRSSAPSTVMPGMAFEFKMVFAIAGLCYLMAS